MISLIGVSTFAEMNNPFLRQCTAHYTVVNQDGGLVWGPAHISADTCAHAVAAARYFYFLTTGDTSVF